MTPKPPKRPSMQPDDFSRQSAKRAPEFKELVVQQQHAETGEQILRLREEVTVEQYRDYLARPENQELMSEDFEYMGLNRREKLRELLIIAKLWLIRDSKINFVRVNESIADMQSDLDNGFLDESGEFREGVLPLFERLTVAEDADFRFLDGNSASGYSSRVASVVLDFSSVVAMTLEFEDQSGKFVKRKYVRVKDCFDKDENPIEAKDLYVSVESLKSKSKIEEFQSEIDFSQARLAKVVDEKLSAKHYSFFYKSLHMIVSKLGLEKAREVVDKLKTVNMGRYVLLNELTLIEKIYGKYGAYECHLIVEKCIKLGQLNLLLSNLHQIKQVYAKDGESKCNELIEIAIQEQSFGLLLSNLSKIKLVYGKDGDSKCKDIVEKAFQEQDVYNILLNFYTIKKLYGKGLLSRCKELVESLIDEKKFDSLSSNLSTINEIYGKDGDSKCKEIIEKAIQNKQASKLLSYLDQIKAVFPIKSQYFKIGDRILSAAIKNKNISDIAYSIPVIKRFYGAESESRFVDIIYFLIKEKAFSYLLGSMPIDEMFSLRSADMYKTIIECAILANDYKILFSNLKIIQEVYKKEFDNQIRKIIDMALEDEQFGLLVRHLDLVKRVYKNKGLDMCKSIVKEALKQHAYRAVLIHLKHIKEVYGEKGTLECNSIIEHLIEEKQFKVIFFHFDFIKPVLDKQSLQSLIQNLCSLDFEQFSLLMSSRAKYFVEKFLKANLSVFVSHNFHTFRQMLLLDTSFVRQLLANLDDLKNAKLEDSDYIYKSIVMAAIITGCVDQVFIHYEQLIDIYPGLQKQLCSDYKTVVENHNSLSAELFVDLIPQSLEQALINRDYAILLQYVPIFLENGYFEMSLGLDFTKYQTFASFQIPKGSEVFTTPDGFEVVTNRRGPDKVWSLTIKRFDHNMQLIDEITSFDLDLIELEELGINYYSHLVTPYAHLRNVIDSRKAYEQKNREFFQNKRFNVTFYPKADHNGFLEYLQAGMTKIKIICILK